MSIGLLRTFEQFIAREAQQNLCVNRIHTHDRFIICQRLRRLVDVTLAEDRVRARSAGGARHGHEIRRRGAQSKEEGHRTKYAARRELNRWRRTDARDRGRGGNIWSTTRRLYCRARLSLSLRGLRGRVGGRGGGCRGSDRRVVVCFGGRGCCCRC